MKTYKPHWWESFWPLPSFPCEVNVPLFMWLKSKKYGCVEMLRYLSLPQESRRGEKRLEIEGAVRDEAGRQQPCWGNHSSFTFGGCSSCPFPLALNPSCLTCHIADFPKRRTLFTSSSPPFAVRNCQLLAECVAFFFFAAADVNAGVGVWINRSIPAPSESESVSLQRLNGDSLRKIEFLSLPQSNGPFLWAGDGWLALFLSR